MTRVVEQSLVIDVGEAAGTARAALDCFRSN